MLERSEENRRWNFTPNQFNSFQTLPPHLAHSFYSRNSRNFVESKSTYITPRKQNVIYLHPEAFHLISFQSKGYHEIKTNWT
jgi:hypothetical protein